VPVVPLQEMLADATERRYGVPAINVFDDLSLVGVLDAAVQRRSPLIVQTSVKTVRAIGSDVLFAMWTAMTAKVDVPVTLHLDHCPERSVITECLDRGWNSVLFDASHLPVQENTRQTVEVVAEARRHGAHVEGEIESITGVEDGVGSDTPAERQSLQTVLDYLDTTGVDVFAPAIGNAHGSYRQAPELDVQRVSDIVAARRVPIALHGGSGLSDDQFRDLIARGCSKVNISTALKETYMQSNLRFLKQAEERGKWDPPSLFAAVHTDVLDLAGGLMDLFGSSGKAG
jgi:ketose-bisphosphate aldolase